MADKNLKDQKTIITFTIKYLKIYGRLTLVYLPFMIAEIFYEDRFNVKGLLYSLQSFIMSGTYLHLWYLPATIIAFWVLHIFLKNFSVKTTMIFAVIFLIIGSLLEGYRGVIDIFLSPLKPVVVIYEYIFLTPRGGVFLGFPFVCLGYFIKIKKPKIPKKLNIVLFILSVVLLLCEVTFIGHYALAKDYNLILSILPFVYFGFLLLLDKEEKTCKSHNIPYGDLSVFIYYYHILILGVLVAIANVFPMSIFNNPTVQFIITTILIHVFYIYSRKI